MSSFIPGIALNRAFYQEAVAPLLAERFPLLAHSAALVGYGSDVLGYDTPQSTDHEWGPRLVLFLSDSDHPRYAEMIDALLTQRLPSIFRGYSTSFVVSAGDGVRVPEVATPGSIHHYVSIVTLRAFLRSELGVAPDQPLQAVDWLVFPEQKLLEVTAGAVYHDGTGQLSQLRKKFAYYPHDLWLYLLSAQWMRLAQEEAFIGRCGAIGDDLGARIIAARLVREMMRLCFLLERRYAPYSKWFGTAFSRLACSANLSPILGDILAAADSHERESHLADAYRFVARKHNALGITSPLDDTISPYYNRPYLVLFADRFAHATSAMITDEEVKALAAASGPIGGVSQFIESTDLLTHADRCVRLRALFGATVNTSAAEKSD